MTTRRALVASAALACTVMAIRWTPGRPRVQGAVEMEMAVPYGGAFAGGEELLLDVYRSSSEDSLRPAVLLIHGGGFVSGSRADPSVAETARRLAGAGYVAFSIDYRLLDQRERRNTWPTPLDDVQRAVRWVRAHAAEYGIDPMRLAAYGASAGGGLAAHLGVRDTRDNSDPDLANYSSRVACVVDLAGPIDSTGSPLSPGDIEFAAAFLGGTFAEIPDVYRDASPLSHIDEETAPFLVVHGTQDTVVSVEHARRLVSTLREKGIDVDYVELPDAGHDVFDWNRVGPMTLSFLERHLRPAR